MSTMQAAMNVPLPFPFRVHNDLDQTERVI